MSVNETIEQKLNEVFSPIHINVENESYRHNVPPGSESHFKVTLVSDDFESLSVVKRHQKVYQLLGAELQAGIHALALHLYTTSEWQAKGYSEPLSPPCHGGSK